MKASLPAQLHVIPRGLALAAALLTAGAATAGQALVPLPSVADFTGGEGWGVALGAGMEYEAGYDGSDEYELEAEPVAAVHWRRGNHLVFAEGPELGWRARLADAWLWQAGLRYEYGLEADDSEGGYLNWIEERDSHVVGFIEARRALDGQWQNWVAARLMGGAADFGVLGVVAAGHRFGPPQDGMGTEVYLFLTFGDEAFINKDFGVTAADALSSSLPETTLSGGYRSTGLNIVHRRQLTEKAQLMLQAGIEQYSSDIGKSPIARDDYEGELGASVIWAF